MCDDVYVGMEVGCGCVSSCVLVCTYMGGVWCLAMYDGRIIAVPILYVLGNPFTVRHTFV